MNDTTMSSGGPGRNCLIVVDYVDLSDGADGFAELLCSSMHSPVFVDLGDGAEDQDLIINSGSGKVYVNGHSVETLTGLKYLNDGSWGVDFGVVGRKKHNNRLLGFLQRVYDGWLYAVYERASYIGLVDNSPLHNRSIWHLIIPDLPKGKIISKNPKKVLDNDVLSW